MKMKYQCCSCIDKHHLPSSKHTLVPINDNFNESPSHAMYVVYLSTKISFNESYNSKGSSESYGNRYGDQSSNSSSNSISHEANFNGIHTQPSSDIEGSPELSKTNYYLYIDKYTTHYISNIHIHHN